MKWNLVQVKKLQILKKTVNKFFVQDNLSGSFSDKVSANISQNPHSQLCYCFHWGDWTSLTPARYHQGCLPRGMEYGRIARVFGHSSNDLKTKPNHTNKQIRQKHFKIFKLGDNMTARAAGFHFQKYHLFPGQFPYWLHLTVVMCQPLLFSCL